MMPDVDWEKVAADVADLPDNPTLFVEWWAFADHLPELVAAIRWGLEAQQRGERVWECRAVEPQFQPEPCDASTKAKRTEGCGWRLIVPLEGEQ